MRQSRVEKRMLGGNTICPPVEGNTQYQWGQRPSWNSGGFRRTWTPQRGWHRREEARRDPNTIDIDAAK